MKRYIGEVAALALLLTGCGEVGTTSVPAAATAPTGPAVGVVGTASTYSQERAGTGTVTIHSLEWKTKVGDKAVAYLAGDVTMEGVTGSVSGNPLYLVARDADGREANSMGGLMSGFDPRLSVGDLTPGRKARGYVVWEIDPKIPHDIEMQSVMGAPLVAWKVPARG